MAKMVLLNVRTFAGGADLTANTNQVEINSSVEIKDATNYGSGGWKEVLAGLASTTIKASGQWEALDTSKVDDAAWARLGLVNAWSIAPVDGSVGSPAYLTQALDSAYTLGGAVGDTAPFQTEANGSWPLARGQIIHPPGTPRTATGNGTGVQLGAVTTGQRLYGALHVLSVAGTAAPTIACVVESDTSNAFAAPNARLTFATSGARSGEILRTAGVAITDTWYRIRWTITGTTPSFLFMASLGIR
jgi:hypothetical protein